jgi:hypothetical protein
MFFSGGIFGELRAIGFRWKYIYQAPRSLVRTISADRRLVLRALGAIAPAVLGAIAPLIIERLMS